jgi:hypothetical protein
VLTASANDYDRLAKLADEQLTAQERGATGRGNLEPVAHSMLRIASSALCWPEIIKNESFV